MPDAFNKIACLRNIAEKDIIDKKSSGEIFSLLDFLYLGFIGKVIHSNGKTCTPGSVSEPSETFRHSADCFNSSSDKTLGCVWTRR